MDEIGKNLKHEKFELHELTSSSLHIKDISQRIQAIDISQIKEIEIIGIISNSGFCGTMEWGMSNPTFILPTNFIYNIINLFKRKNDTVHIKVSLKDGKKFIALGNKNHFNKLQKLLTK